MEAPFPGMDPYLELPSLWPDVHHRIITAICDQLQTRIVPRYIAQITPYTALEQIGIAATRRTLMPDVGRYERDAPGQSNVAVAVDAPRPDPDVALNLTAVVQQVYRNARYDLQVDYRDAPPPELNPEDAHLARCPPARPRFTSVSVALILRGLRALRGSTHARSAYKSGLRSRARPIATAAKSAPSAAKPTLISVISALVVKESGRF